MKKLFLLIIAVMLLGIVTKAQVNLQNGLVPNYPNNGNVNDERGNINNVKRTNTKLTNDRFGKANNAIKVKENNSLYKIGNPVPSQTTVNNTQVTQALYNNIENLGNDTIWQQKSYGMYGGDVTCFAVSGSNIFAGTNGGGIFLSTNNGTSWTAVNNGLTNIHVRALAIIGVNIFAGTDGGMFLSTNNGSSWTEMNNGFSWDHGILSIAISGNNIFAGFGWPGVYLSTDTGKNWTAVNTGLPTYTAIRTLIVSGSNVFAGTDGGVFLTTDNGSNWTAMNSGLTNKGITSLAISGSNIFAGTSWDGGIFLSTDYGNNWTAVDSGLTNKDIKTLAINGNNIYAGTGNGIFLSNNNGYTWSEISTGLTITSVNTLFISGSNIFAGTAGAGVFLSTNGGYNWTDKNYGLTGTIVLSFAISGSNIFAGTNYNGVFLSTNNGSNWTGVSNGWINFCANSLAISGNRIFAGVNGGVLFSDNNGNDWTYCLTNTNISSIAINGSIICAGGWDGIFLSTDNGNNWTAKDSGLTNKWITKLAISGSNIIAGTFGSGIFLSTDSGNYWTAKDTGMTSMFAGYIMSLATSGSNIYAGTEDALYLSTDSCSNWKAVNNGLTNTWINTLAASGSNIFVGTSDGISLSADSGSHWAAVNTGLINTDIQSIAISGSNIFVGTNGAGVSKRLLSETKGYQTITFAALPTKTFGNPSFGLTATASSGLTVTYSSSNTDVATISGNKVTIVGAGIAVITATQPGNAIYFAATPVMQTLTVNKANQTIIFNPLPTKKYGDPPFILTSLGGASGNVVTYTSSNTDVATINGDTVTIVGAGTTDITASQAGNTNYNPATSVTRTLTVNQANQTIIFNPLPTKKYGDPPFILTSLGGASGNVVTYTSSNTDVATINGDTVKIVGAGTTDITASQAGNTNYNSATPVTRTLIVNSVNKASQTITFAALPSKTYGDGPFDLTATASSGLAVSYISSNTDVATISGNTVTIVSTGTTDITASQAGNTDYNPAESVTRTLIVNDANKASQTITFAELPAKTYGDGPFDLNATASSGLTITYTSSNTYVATISGNTVTIVSTGTTDITASQAGNADYNPAESITRTLIVNAVNKASQTITFAELPSKTYGDGPFDLTATASSGLTVSYISSNTDVATISGNTVTIVSAGTTDITASQAGDANYNAAPTVMQPLTVTSGSGINFISMQQIKVYPNPSKGGIFLIENESSEKFEISICDLNSKLIFTAKISGKGKKQVDLSDCPKGIYVIRFYNVKSNGIEKLVIE